MGSSTQIGQENSRLIDLCREDYGSGSPVALVHRRAITWETRCHCLSNKSIHRATPLSDLGRQ
jgi:hypothetical protein